MVTEPITILIPTTPDRRERLAECVKAIQENTDGVDYRVLVYENTIGWTKAIHKALNGINGFVVVIGNDVKVQKGWLKALKESFEKNFPNDDGIAHPYDEFHNGSLITHPFAHSSTLKKYISTEYFHCFSDNELTIVMKSLGKEVYVPEAKIEHLHYVNKKAPIDETYKRIYEEMYEKDRQTFIRRAKNIQI